MNPEATPVFWRARHLLPGPQMTRTVFRLILLVSCAHALVHVFELALPSVEQMIGDDLKASKATTGALGMAWRLPFGLLAMAAGWPTNSSKESGRKALSRPSPGLASAEMMRSSASLTAPAP